MWSSKRFIVVVLFLYLFIPTYLFSQEKELLEELKKFPEVVSVQKIEQYPFFKEAYEILIEQYLDHGNPAAGKFNQRIVFSHYNNYSPVVLVTEGYRADYAVKSSYINELSKIVEANQIVVEHRYFGKSIPDNKNWEYLTLENACGDYHRIIRIFKRIYNHNNKWISTGISKGGQTTMAFKAYYPDDVDIWIPYVAPLNFGLEDGRHEKFFAKVGTEKCREAILSFQKEILSRRQELQPMLDSVIRIKEYSYEIPDEQVLDFCVLEYSFAFWQWGHNCGSIPPDSLASKVLFDHLVKVSSPEYFSHQGIEPIDAFFPMAAKEMGYYGYDIKPFSDLLIIEDAKGYFSTVFLKDDIQFKYNKKVSKFINKSLQKDGDHMLLIYGEYDPWTSSAFEPKPNCKAIKFVSAKASHRARIDNMPIDLKKDVYMLLETWLEED